MHIDDLLDSHLSTLRRLLRRMLLVVLLWRPRSWLTSQRCPPLQFMVLNDSLVADGSLWMKNS